MWKKLKPETIKKYNKKNKKKKLCWSSFQAKFFSEEDIKQYPSEDIFISQDEFQDSIQKNKSLEYSIPTIEFLFDSSPNDFDYKSFIQLLKESIEGKAIIINIENKKGIDTKLEQVIYLIFLI